jgi:two-component system, sensor histidine kinase RegB
VSIRPPSPRTPALEDEHAVHRINASWLARLRWAALLGQASVIAYVQWGLPIGLPLGPLAGILAIELAMNVLFELWLPRRPPLSERAIALTLACDVSCFTGLLYFTGGPFNPFSFLYLVHIALAAIVLPPRWTWALVLFCVGASAALFVNHVPLPMDHHAHLHHMMHGGVQPGEPLDMHLRGMWVAFAVAAAFIVYFINRVTRALSERERELAGAREVAARSEKLASMATLAAGAAHELATPLSTIAVVAKELERAGDTDALAADARVIREQVERCRDILGQMAGGAGVSPGEISVETEVPALVKLCLGGLQDPGRVTVSYSGDSESVRLLVPPRATAQALRNVVKNAIDASPAGASVELRLELDAQALRVVVTDSGSGMSEEVLAHAMEPFFTTKEPGHGMGLGLFLTRSVVDMLGGSVSLGSTPGKGTRVVVTLPREPATIGRIAAEGQAAPR